MDSSPEPADRKRFLRAVAALLGILLTCGIGVVAVQFAERKVARGAAYADMDGDGYVDLFINPFQSMTRTRLGRPAETYAHWIDPARNDIDRLILARLGFSRLKPNSSITVRTLLISDRQAILKPIETPQLDPARDQLLELRARLEN